MGAEANDPNHRLPLLDPQGLTRDQSELLDRMEENLLPWARESGFKAVAEDGRLLGPFNALLYNPELGAAHVNYLSTERNATALDARVREVVILTVGAVWQSHYEVYAHRAVAAKAGLPPAAIEALATGGDPHGLEPAERIAHHFVKALVKEHRVPADVFEQAFQTFGHKGLVDLVHLVGLYLATAAMLNAFEVPVPDAASA